MKLTNCNSNTIYLVTPETEHGDKEEAYIILWGSGDLQIDDDCFSVCEDSIVREVLTPSRDMRNSSDEPMIYMIFYPKIIRWTTILPRTYFVSFQFGSIDSSDGINATNQKTLS